LLVTGDVQSACTIWSREAIGHGGFGRQQAAGEVDAVAPERRVHVDLVLLVGHRDLVARRGLQSDRVCASVKTVWRTPGRLVSGTYVHAVGLFAFLL
jgi:hypothetical protein